MPLPGHASDCECCVVVDFRAQGSKRPRAGAGADADLENFLPPDPKRTRTDADAPVPEEDEEDEEPEGGEENEAEEEPEAVEEEANLIHSTLFASFDQHVTSLDAARVKRVEILSFKSALEDDGGDEVNPDATQDELDGLGIWLPGDERQGDVNFRTLLKLLTRVDQRGFERSAQQLDFHTAFMKASARVIYRSSWATDRPAIMAAHGWETSNSEVLISTPRRFVRPIALTPARARSPRTEPSPWLRREKHSASPSSARA